MVRTKECNRKPFYVIQFLEPPHEGIDKYVCVPQSWILPPIELNHKVVVAYPKNEDPLTVQNRVKKNEKHSAEWGFHFALIIHESDTYGDAITKRNNDGPSGEKQSQGESKDTRSGLALDKNAIKLKKPIITGKPSKHLRKRKRLSEIFHGLKYIRSSSNDNTNSEHTQADLNNGEKSLTPDQTDSQKFAGEKSASTCNRKSEQAFSMPVINIEDGDFVYVQPEPLYERLSSNRDSSYTLEQASQPEQVIERLITRVHNEQSLPERRVQDVTAGQSKEADDSNKTQLHQISTAPLTVPRPSSRSDQHSLGKHTHMPCWSAYSAGYPNLRSPATNEASFIPATYSQYRPYFQGFIDTPSTPYYLTNPITHSTRSLHSTITKQSSSVTDNFINEKTCVENIAGSTSTGQDPSSSTVPLHFSSNSVVILTPRYAREHKEEVLRQPVCNSRIDNKGNCMNQNFSKYMATLAMQNFSNEPPPYQSHFVSQPYDKDYLQQIAYVNSIAQSQFQTSTMPGELIKNKSNSIKPNTQNVGMNIQLPSQSNVSNQSHHNFKHQQQRQNLPNYQNHPYLPRKSKTNSQKTVIKRTQSLAMSNNSIQLPLKALLAEPSSLQSLLALVPGYFFRDPRIQKRLNLNPTKHQISDPIVPENMTTTQDFEVQTESLHDRSDDTRSELLSESNVYLNPKTEKMVVDQITRTDLGMDIDNCKDETAESYADESATTVVYSMCQTDEYLMEEQDLPYQETDPHSGDASHKLVSNDVLCADDPCVDTKANAFRESTPSESNTEMTISENPQMQQRLLVQQEILKMFGTQFIKMNIVFHSARDMLNHLQSWLILIVTILIITFVANFILSF